MPLRLASARDIPLLVRHRRAMWEDMGGQTPAALDAADPVYARWARDMMKKGRFAAWILESRRGEPVASGAVWVTFVHPRPTSPTGATAYLLSMYTAPEHRGKGRARRIVKAAIAWSKEQGLPRMTLHASEMGRPIYEKLGFERTWEMKLDLARPGRTNGEERRRSARRTVGEIRAKAPR